MKKKLLRIPFFFIFLLSSPSVVLAAGELDQLRTEVNTLKTRVESSNAKLAEALNQLISIQQEFASIKGNLESGGHFFEEQKRTLTDYDQRITALEDKIGIMMTLLKEVRQGSLNAKTGTLDEAQTKEFQSLLDLINAEDYNGALQGFQAFLQKYPKTSLADSAQYWIAESYYSLKDFKKAISEYQIVIQKYPTSSKVKQALLKQGFSFYGLKMYPEARLFLEKVITDYPNTSESAKAGVKLKEIDRLPRALESLPVNSLPLPVQTPLPSVPGAVTPQTSTGSRPLSPNLPTNPKPTNPVSDGLYD